MFKLKKNCISIYLHQITKGSFGSVYKNNTQSSVLVMQTLVMHVLVILELVMHRLFLMQVYFSVLKIVYIV